MSSSYDIDVCTRHLTTQKGRYRRKYRSFREGKSRIGRVEMQHYTGPILPWSPYVSTRLESVNFLATTERPSLATSIGTYLRAGDDRRREASQYTKKKSHGNKPRTDQNQKIISVLIGLFPNHGRLFNLLIARKSGRMLHIARTLQCVENAVNEDEGSKFV